MGEGFAARVHHMGKFFLVLCSLCCFSATTAGADTLILPPADLDLVGEIRYTQAQQQDTLLDIARANDLGRDEIVHANPDVDIWLPGEGTRILLPTRYILPAAPRRGLVLNVPEMRLYYYPEPRRGENRKLLTHPVSIGRMDWKSPLGITRIVAKQKNPPWRPPDSILEEARQKGTPLPEVVPAGPDNPLGRYALRLGLPGYLIHSTNKPYGLGMRVTHGCIRMYPEDIEPLFAQIPLNTQVNLVDQPVKLGWLADTLFVEVHPPLEEDVERRNNLMRATLELIHTERQRKPFVLDGSALRQAVEQALGIPVPVSRSGALGTDAMTSLP
jgi:L,D-transpeptidase ErfK/SrfK